MFYKLTINTRQRTIYISAYNSSSVPRNCLLKNTMTLPQFSPYVCSQKNMYMFAVRLSTMSTLSYARRTLIIINKNVHITYITKTLRRYTLESSNSHRCLHNNLTKLWRRYSYTHKKMTSSITVLILYVCMCIARLYSQNTSKQLGRDSARTVCCYRLQSTKLQQLIQRNRSHTQYLIKTLTVYTNTDRRFELQYNDGITLSMF